MLAGGGSVGSNGSFATPGSIFTYSAATMPWYTMEIVDNGADTTTLSSDTDPTNTDGGANADNEGTDGETGALFDPDGNQVGSSGQVAADRWGVMEGSDGSTIFIYEIENYDDIDIYAFSEPLVDGVTYTTSTQNPRDTAISYGQMVCLARGTRVRTPDGPRAIETLVPGDSVITVDNGAQPVLAVTQQTFRFDPEGAEPANHPVRIRAGTIGNLTDLIVSPQHRIVVRERTGDTVQDRFAAAKLLAEEHYGGIRYACGVRSVDYHNLFLPRHNVIFAENAQVESLYPGPLTRRSPFLSVAPALRANFPQLWWAGTLDEVAQIYGPPARTIMSRRSIRSAIAGGRLGFPTQDCLAAA